MLLLSSCGVFEPRDTFEIPELKVPVDRFNFGAILDSAGKKLLWKNYETFFCDTLHYNYHNLGVYGKKSFIDHLQQLEHQHPRFSITWGDIDSYEEGNVLNITNVTYTVIEDTALVDGEVFTGTSKMVIVRDVDYKIVTWDDFPNSDQKPFFAPLD
jgi:hypothetical protein